MVAATPSVADLQSLDEAQLRELNAQLQAQLRHAQALNDKLTHELALLRRLKFAAHSERLSAEQRHLFEEAIEADLGAVEAEIDQLEAADPQPQPTKRTARRQALPAELPRREIRHEPPSSICACGCTMKRIGEDIAEKLDYAPGAFSVERHIRGKWACAQCETITQAPVDPHIIDKGIPTAGLLAQVLVAKYTDHLPLHRQEQIFGRAGLTIARSTLAQWVGACGVQLQPLVDALRQEMLACSVLHADETPVQMLKPASARDGKTHRAYLWAYAPGVFDDLKAVVYDFCESRAGSNAQHFLQGWQGALVCDDFAGYKGLFTQGIAEIGCWAHARRKFFELHAANKSMVAEQALALIGQLYDIEREAKALDTGERQALRQARTKPVLGALHQWMVLTRQKVPDNSATAKALDYSLKRWAALVRFAEDGQVPIDNNWIENQIRPIALGRSNWLFAGSLRGGQRAAAVMSLIQSARLNGHDPYAYIKDVLTRLPMQRASQIGELLPHRWQQT